MITMFDPKATLRFDDVNYISLVVNDVHLFLYCVPAQNAIIVNEALWIEGEGSLHSSVWG